MKITFIALPWIFSEEKFKRHEGFSQNLGIAYLSTFLEKHGHSVKVIDAFAEGYKKRRRIHGSQNTFYVYGLDAGETAKQIPLDSDFIGISCPFTSMAFLVDEFASAIKQQYPDKPIIAGGIYPTQFPLEALTTNIDIVVTGEGEIPLLEILSGNRLCDIKGLAYRDATGINNNGLSSTITNPDEIPFPARHLLPMETYFKRSARGEINKRAISMITSRGCPYDCRFCSLHTLHNNYGRVYRARTPENVIAEIDALIEKYGPVHIEFEDDNLTVDTKRAKKLFSLLANRKITWAITSGVMINHLDEELIRQMKESGCTQLNLALESGNEKVLKAMNKKVSLKKAEEIVEICSKYKLYTVAFLMVGYPGETTDSFDKTLHFLQKLKKRGLREIAPFIVNPHKGTPLYEECKSMGYLKGEENVIFNSHIVCIETDDFDRALVKEWMDRSVAIFHPWRWRLKLYLETILTDRGYRKVIDFYRKVKNFLSEKRLSINR